MADRSHSTVAPPASARAAHAQALLHRLAQVLLDPFQLGDARAQECLGGAHAPRVAQQGRDADDPTHDVRRKLARQLVEVTLEPGVTPVAPGRRTPNSGDR
jgi:hypothetical protein